MDTFKLIPADEIFINYILNASAYEKALAGAYIAGRKASVNDCKLDILLNSVIDTKVVCDK